MHRDVRSGRPTPTIDATVQHVRIALVAGAPDVNITRYVAQVGRVCPGRQMSCSFCSGCAQRGPSLRQKAPLRPTCGTRPLARLAERWVSQDGPRPGPMPSHGGATLGATLCAQRRHPANVHEGFVTVTSPNAWRSTSFGAQSVSTDQMVWHGALPPRQPAATGRGLHNLPRRQRVAPLSSITVAAGVAAWMMLNVPDNSVNCQVTAGGPPGDRTRNPRIKR
jgi:hypothetical protein